MHKRTSAKPGPLRSASSAPTLPSIHQNPGSSQNIYGRQWTTDHKRLLHESRERSWLRQQGKHAQVDFSDLERTELRHYFEAIAEVEGKNKQRRIRADRLEDMLISLGLADRRKEVENIVQAIDDSGLGELDFEQYLTIVRTRADPALIGIFKAMIDGKLGDRNLNFRTVISGYRRGMIMDATGARSVGEPEPDKKRKQELEAAKRRGTRILNNFAALQKSRFDQGDGELPFDGSGYVPPGGLEMLWHTVCAEHEFDLAKAPTTSADGRTGKTKRTLDPPRSPREIIESIVQGGPKRSTKKKSTRSSVIVAEEPSEPPMSEVSGSRPGTSSKEGNFEFRTSLDDP
jgi:hypothetical protein